MSTVTVIAPEEIKKGDAQNIAADLTKFDVAGAQVELALKALVPYEKISSVEEQTQALEKMKEVNSVGKAIEEKRKQLVKPFNDSVKEINEYAKKMTGKIDTKITLVKGVVLAFQKEEEARVLKLRSIERVETLKDLSFIRNDASKTFSRDDVGTLTFHEITSWDDDAFVAAIGRFTDKIQENANEALEAVQETDDLFDAFASDEDKAEVAQKVEEVKSASVTPTVSYGGGYSTNKLKGSTKTWKHEVTDAAVVPIEYLTVDDAKIKAAIKAGTRLIPGVRIYQDESLTLR